MKRMGMLAPSAPPSSAGRRSYKAYFDSNKLTSEDVKAFDELFPATKRRTGRTTRRTLLAAA